MGGLFSSTEEPSDPYFSFSSVVTYIPLSEYDSEYLSVKRMVTNKQNFKIDGIEKIENPFLKKAYELKKEQKRVNYPYCEERLLFHGTTRANVDAICKFNFDWRLCKAHKYGKGVSFSPNSTYASCYSEKNVHNKVMIVAKVLIGRSCYGNEFMTLPDDGCDTSQKGVEAIVVVKYEDNEFLPVYKIKYHLIRENVGRRNHNRGPRVVNNYDFLIYD
ncbi:PARP domain containing protein [Asbolus verrucosus]|uniref:Poly [ADP-ribose] polymerase n=1 Tax=Asbolus verrucosus TaxID=1661398 RepID=A0A482VIP4_ASBVE|nr:PARP domain containing protein [Asbolus verrucosus]